MIAKIELKFALASLDTEPNTLKLQIIHRGEMLRSKALLHVAWPAWSLGQIEREETRPRLPNFQRTRLLDTHLQLQSLHSRVRRPRGGHTHYCTDYRQTTAGDRICWFDKLEP